jgi:hypothetical protein
MSKNTLTKEQLFQELEIKGISYSKKSKKEELLSLLATSKPVAREGRSFSGEY